MKAVIDREKTMDSKWGKASILFSGSWIKETSPKSFSFELVFKNRT